MIPSRLRFACWGLVTWASVFLLTTIEANGPVNVAGDRSVFVSRPNVPYDDLMFMQGMEGEGTAVIKIDNGRIATVRMAKSTGNAYLDARAIAWIQARWQPSKGASGTFKMAVSFQLGKSDASYRRLDPIFNIGRTNGAQWQGKVAVTASNGKITKVGLLTGTGSKDLDQKAIDWVRMNCVAPRGFTGTSEIPLALRWRK
jgi:hypothetical protein